MNFFSTLQSWIGFYQVKNQVKNIETERSTVPFSAAKKIGYLYEATEDRNYEIMKHYLKGVRNQQKDVHALGFIDQKKIPANKFPQLGLDFFCRKDLNWKGIPGNLVINNFINNDFDIIVNLTDNHVFPLCYIAAVSRARFRVGKFNRQYVNFYDMMIHTDEQNLEYILVETERYLKNLKVQ